MFSYFRMLRVRFNTRFDRQFESHHQPQIDYLVFGPKHVDLNYPTVFRTEDPVWLNQVQPSYVRNVIRLEPSEFQQLVEYWYNYYANHRFLNHQKYQRAQDLYQKYVEHSH